MGYWEGEKDRVTSISAVLKEKADYRGGNGRRSSRTPRLERMSKRGTGDYQLEAAHTSGARGGHGAHEKKNFWKGS